MLLSYPVNIYNRDQCKALTEVGRSRLTEGLTAEDVRLVNMSQYLVC